MINGSGHGLDTGPCGGERKPGDRKGRNYGENRRFARMDLPNRKQIRLPDYDYSAPGAYFVTVCTQNRRCILSDICVGAGALDGPKPHLTDMGKIVENYILSTERIPGVHVDKYVIMPNHIHLILTIDENGGPSRAPAPTNEMIPPCDWYTQAVCEQRNRRKHLAARILRARDPQRARLSGDLGLHRRQSRALGGGPILHRLTPAASGSEEK